MNMIRHIKSCALVLLAVFPLLASAEHDQVPKFREYPAGRVYTGPHAKVVLSTAEERDFRTRLREASKEPANFAGEYVLAVWGCGTSCRHGAAVSLKTGRVVFLPGTICCWEGEGDPLQFRLNSRLMVAAGLINEDGVYGAHFYEFTGRKFRLVKTIPVARNQP